VMVLHLSVNMRVGFLFRNVCAIWIDESLTAFSISEVVSWRLTDRLICELEKPQQCSPHLGNISMDEHMGECHNLHSHGEGWAPIGAVTSRMWIFHMHLCSYCIWTREFG
jgi:hypothetical protein